MSLKLASTAHAIGTNPCATDGPFCGGGWFNASIAQSKQYMCLANSGDINNVYSLGTDRASASGKANAFLSQSSSVQGQLTGTVLSSGVWTFIAVAFTSAGAPTLWIGGSKFTAAGGINPTGINRTVLGGRISDFSNGPNGDLAHTWFLTRIPNDLEMTYLQGGGNPSWLTPARYWRCDATQTTTITDETGNENLTGTSLAAGTNDPPNGIASYWTAAALANQSYTQGVAITSIDWTTKFAKTAAAVDYTTSLVQRSAPGTATTATAGGAATNLITVASVTNFAVNGYASVTTNSNPVLILAISGNTLLLGSFLTWSNGDNVYPFTVSAKTFSFYTSGNTFSGTPAGGDVGTFVVIPRAVNNTTATLIADGPAFTITVASSGTTPSFSSGPNLSSTQTDGYTFGATSNQTATLHLSVYVRGSATPSVANVVAGAGTGFVSHFTSALTSGSAGSVTATGLVNPIYDAYLALNNGNGSSALASFTSLQKLPPSGFQYVPITLSTVSAVSRANPAQVTVTGHGRSIGDWVALFGLGGMTQLNGFFGKITIVDANNFTLNNTDSTGYTIYTSGGNSTWGRSMYANASPAAVTGDIGIWPAVTTPGNYALSPTVEGVPVYAAASDASRQSYAVSFYSVASNTIVASATDYTNNQAPAAPSGFSALFLPLNQTVNINLAALAQDPNGDTLSVTGSPPPGTSITSNTTLTGVPTLRGIYATALTWTDLANESVTATQTFVVGNVDIPQMVGLNDSAAIQALQAVFLGNTEGRGPDPNPLGPAPAGTVLAQSLTGQAAPGTVIGLTVSNGISSAPNTTPTTPVSATILKSSTLVAEEKLNALSSYQLFKEVATLSLGPEDAPGTVYRFFRVPASAKIDSLDIMNDANPTGSSYKLGLMYPNGGGLIVANSDAILLPAGTSLDIARPNWTPLFTPIAVNTAASVANVGKTLWQLLGLKADPSPASQDQLYDVCLTAITPGTLGGNVALRLGYLRNPDRGLIPASAVQ